ncbi:hypothetical protein HY605_04285 [Candidatus Peregrinibacteria bacterium]|nr:hypothetical protein [Candidatus Peregrinibacteria bacterium]
MSKNLWSLVIVAMLCVGLVGYAEAASTVYETGFENHYFDTGTFAVGPLTGDGWWSSNPDWVISDGSVTGKLAHRWGGYMWTTLDLLYSPVGDISLDEGIVTITYRDGYHDPSSSQLNATCFTTAPDVSSGGPNLNILSTAGWNNNGRWKLNGLTTVDAGPVNAFCDITWKIDLDNNTMSLSGYSYGWGTPVAWGPVSTTIAAGTKLDYFTMYSLNDSRTQMENLSIVHQRGYDHGYDVGFAAGAAAHAGDYNAGYDAGFDDGEAAHANDYQDGYNAGYNAGFAAGEAAHANDYQNGYNAGRKSVLDVLPPGIRKNVEAQQGFAK